MKRLINKTTVLILIIILLFSNLTTITNAAINYLQAFSEDEIWNRNFVAMSPIRESSSGGLVSRWPYITSTNNEPRYIGTKDVHQGTDLRAAYGTEIYPIYPGKVSYILPKSSTDRSLRNIVVNCDITGDGIEDNYYIQYMHVAAKSTLKKDDIVTTSTLLGVVDAAPDYAHHLHIEHCDFNKTIHYKLGNDYRTIYQWNYGKDLDLMTRKTDYVSGNLLQIYAYYPEIISSTSVIRTAIKSMTLYYKIGSTGIWKKSLTLFTSKPDFLWEIDLKTATGATIGQVVYYYVVCEKTTGYTAIYPAYFNTTVSSLNTDEANKIALFHKCN